MKWVKRLGIIVLILAALSAVTLVLTGHQLSPRPSSSIVELKPASDVQYVTANRLQFGYIERGEGPLVLLFHGYPETARSWDAVQTRLADEGYRAIAIYMRGYPPSAAADDYSVAALGQDVIGLIDAFGEERAIIVGHDWGASAVYEAAFMAPEKVSHLVAMSVPHPRGIEEFDVVGDAPHFLYYQSPFAERLIWSNNFAHIRKIYDIWSPGFAVPEAEIEEIISTFKHPGAIKNALGYYRALIANGDENSQISADSTINTPTLILAGSEDGAAPVELFTAAGPAFTGDYALEVIPGIGHFPQLEAPDHVVDAIVSFLDAER